MPCQLTILARDAQSTCAHRHATLYIPHRVLLDRDLAGIEAHMGKGPSGARPAAHPQSDPALTSHCGRDDAGEEEFLAARRIATRRSGR